MTSTFDIHTDGPGLLRVEALNDQIGIPMVLKRFERNASHKNVPRPTSPIQGADVLYRRLYWEIPG